MINLTRVATLVRLVAYGTFAALVAQGCGSDDTAPATPNKPDSGTHNTGGTAGSGGATGGVQSDAGHKVSCGTAPPECLGDRAMRICSPEGDWVTIPCGTDEKCASGACAVTKPCTPGDKKCATDGAAKVCDNDGSAWVVTLCGDGKICNAGDCVLDVKGAECTPGQGRCIGTTTRLRCLPQGKGFESFDCPATAPCANGECQGPVCNIGDTSCSQDTKGRQTVRTCTDGTSFTETPCGISDACTFVSDGVRSVAKCVTQTACGFSGTRVCGSPTDPSLDPSKSFSECRFTNSGTTTWSRVDCTAPATCDPANPGCTTTCLPGETRCAGDSGFQTCGTDATWGSLQKCSGNLACRQGTATTLGDGSVKPPGAECVDRECALLSAGFTGTPSNPGFDGGFGGFGGSAGKPGAGGFPFPPPGGFGGTFGGLPTGPATGLCDGNQIRVCSPDGTLQPSADCKVGVCKAVTTNVISGYHPGTCSNDCKAGESRCVSDGLPLFLTCAADGTWSTTYQTCGQACTTATDVDGTRTALCGDNCLPNSTRCDGNNVQTCGAGKTWLPSVACTVGRCSTATGSAACIADCVPGSTVCTGDFKPASDGVSTGTASSATCTSAGLLPSTPTACAGTKTCRTSKNGSTIGCVECMGPNAPGGNDSGLVDTRCAQGTDLQTCNQQNTWATATNCGSGMSCFIGSPVACGQCPNVFSPGACSESFLRSQFGSVCPNFGLGTARRCGSTPDCCSAACNPTGGQFAFCAPDDFSPCFSGSTATKLSGSLPLSVPGTTLLGDDTVTPSCGFFFGSAPDTLYSFVAPQSSTYSFDTFGSTIDTVLSLVDPLSCSEIQCNDNSSFSTLQSRVVIDLAAGQRVFLSVDGRGDYTLNVNDVGTPGCGNGIVDNGEQCDGQDFNGLDCFNATFGSLPGGFLSCFQDCSIDTSNCTSGATDGGVGGIGGFGGGFGGGPIIGAGGVVGPPPPPLGGGTSP